MEAIDGLGARLDRIVAVLHQGTPTVFAASMVAVLNPVAVSAAMPTDIASFLIDLAAVAGGQNPLLCGAGLHWRRRHRCGRKS